MGRPQQVDLCSRKLFSVHVHVIMSVNVTVSGPVDPVVAEVDADCGEDPGERGVPGEAIEAVVGVHVEVESEQHAGGDDTRQEKVVITLS